MADADLEDFDGVLRFLRGIAATCEPPVGVGSFDLLYATTAEVVVWYSPAREHQQAREVTISAGCLSAAWSALLAGEQLDLSTLETLGNGVAGGRWLLALLAQLPGVRVHDEPLAVTWAAEPEPIAAALPDSPAAPDASVQRRSRRRSRSA